MVVMSAKCQKQTFRAAAICVVIRSPCQRAQAFSVLLHLMNFTLGALTIAY